MVVEDAVSKLQKIRKEVTIRIGGGAGRTVIKLLVVDDVLFQR
jgi:hypothetical protein